LFFFFVLFIKISKIIFIIYFNLCIFFFWYIKITKVIFFFIFLSLFEITKTFLLIFRIIIIFLTYIFSFIFSHFSLFK
jgi:hypothetical protein